jgi:hypothetical protein
MGRGHTHLISIFHVVPVGGCSRYSFLRAITPNLLIFSLKQVASIVTIMPCNSPQTMLTSWKEAALGLIEGACRKEEMAEFGDSRSRKRQFRGLLSKLRCLPEQGDGLWWSVNRNASCPLRGSVFVREQNDMRGVWWNRVRDACGGDTGTERSSSYSLR